jgi:hypothetical protein
LFINDAILIAPLEESNFEKNLVSNFEKIVGSNSKTFLFKFFFWQRIGAKGSTKFQERRGKIE